MAYTSVISQPTGIFSNIGAVFKSFIAAAQYGRMVSVLSNMSDTQLAAIGITRSEIPSHAATLTSSET